MTVRVMEAVGGAVAAVPFHPDDAPVGRLQRRGAAGQRSRAARSERHVTEAYGPISFSE